MIKDTCISPIGICKCFFYAYIKKYCTKIIINICVILTLAFCLKIAYNFNQDKCFNRVVKTYETFQKVKNNLCETHF